MSLCREHEIVKVPRVPKRIILCCDGTWQSSVSGKKNIPSNVTRLCRSLNGFGQDENGKAWQQIVWYDSGIGTTSLAVGQKIEGAIGQGLEGNVIEAYNFCVMNYHPDDQIMCFGFSRGAYTARTIAGLISDVGICSKKDLNRFPDLWEAYKGRPLKNEPFFASDAWFEWIEGKADEHQGATGKEFIFAERPNRDWAQKGSRIVEVVGVYDTVGAIGMPAVLGLKLPSNWLPGGDNAGWQNVTLSTNVKHAFQALALDEHREAFSPTLWYLPKFGNADVNKIEAQKLEIEAKASEWKRQLDKAIDLKSRGNATDAAINEAARKLNKAARDVNEQYRIFLRLQDDLNHQNHPRTLRQVWFPGYHIHIGGGSNSTLKKEGDMEEMSNITFSWMLDQIKPFLFLNKEYLESEREDRKTEIEAIPVNLLENESWRSWTGRNVSAVASAILHPFANADKPQPKYRKYGWGTGNLEDSFGTFYYLNGSLPRTPGAYDILDDNKQPVGDTCEFIHPVVGFRKHIMKEDYKPVCGAKYKRSASTYVDPDGNKKPCFEYMIGNARRPLREWHLGGLDSYERLAIAGEKAREYVKELDEAVGVKVEKSCMEVEVQKPVFQGGYGHNGHQQQWDFQSTNLQSKGFSTTSEEILIEESVTRG
ncbi:hypothetical protein PENANT_c019G02855 [Penicillium antarcticum]|uniref:T6SS Phospholipase effector Tle1-like catalytic domain-containing protein n=1 Tax=Penicillium antarcticum TaxID=416450 RepID=A0A1V6Q0R5_9EURO|nr:uncharacterized protein N7508_001130 [Penicillium antarcticum]KAJ5316622.1 hypothetical protein N7508_001130 [Penicillium antarcticum]OQD82823.1 hypothetical protein PENANT_c019G02855 [Penicillium antarcticum]